MKKENITIKEYLQDKAFSFLGLLDSNINPQVKADRLTFINDINDIKKTKLKEYNVWYCGDSDELLNFYTNKNTLDYNTDPIYDRNKRSYYWCVASTESDIKRTHSGQPRNIVDTLVNIVGLPKIHSELEPIKDRLEKILNDNNFDRIFCQEQLPLTLVEGWGCYKINYDSRLRDTPILLYYRADSVDFIYKSNQLIAIVFQDYYTDRKGNNYILFETRHLVMKKSGLPDLYIEKDLFRLTQSEIMIKCELTDLPQLRDIEPKIILNDYNGFLAVPTIIYSDNNGDFYGRSIFTGKIDQFDDLDQCISQAANTVRRSTTHEYYNSLYLEKDPNTGMPIQPHDFDRKYILFRGNANGDGTVNGSFPVQVTQPALNFEQYSVEQQNILINILNGIMSPATLGIDVAKRDNAAAQREKEKVTIFTRNTIIAETQKSLVKLFNELLCADQLMNQNQLTCREYNVSVKFDEFADSSFESKLDTLGGAFTSGLITPEMFVEMLYKDTITKAEKEKQIRYITETQESKQQPYSPEQLGEFGQMGAENEYNELAELGGEMYK